jgi:hypothetical protein
VSFTSSMFQSVAGVPVMPIVSVMLAVSVIAGLGVFFKPLLSGMAKAAVLMVRPRLTREQRAARALPR